MNRNVIGTIYLHNYEKYYHKLDKGPGHLLLLHLSNIRRSGRHKVYTKISYNRIGVFLLLEKTSRWWKELIVLKTWTLIKQSTRISIATQDAPASFSSLFFIDLKTFLIDEEWMLFLMTKSIKHYRSSQSLDVYVKVYVWSRKYVCV